MSIYLTRLQGERKQWRKDHPFGFVAKPNKASDGGLDLMNWTLKIPGRKGTAWAGSTFPVTMTFSQEYPTKPPKCQFPAGFYHPNIYPSGTVCLSILNEGEDWRPSHTLKDIVLGIQELLDNPNIKSPAQQEAFDDFKSNKEAYKLKVSKQVRKYRDDE